MKFQKEINKVTSLIDPELLYVLAKNNAIIAGGALTSVFTNSPINDVDIYFPSAEAFARTIFAVYNKSYDTTIKTGTINYGWKKLNDSLLDFSAVVSNITNKSVMLIQDQNYLQFINYKFFSSPESIFEKYDFTCNMAAIVLNIDSNDEVKTELVMHEDFLQHNSQRYLKFNANTSYPLVSAMRVAKYKERGYNISKAEFMKLLLAVNVKQIDSWNKLFDEAGGMYGEQPEDIFDVTQPFSLYSAMQTLDKIEIKDKIKPFNNGSCINLEDIILKQEHAFPIEVVKLIKQDNKS